MVAGFGVNQLDIHSEAVASPLHRPFEHIADVQLTSELLYVNALPLEGERSVTCNHKRPIDTRQVRRQAFRDPIDEIILLGTAAYVSERQDHNGKAWR